MSLSEKRLADIRERHRVGLGLERPGDVAALLREVERLRAGIEAFATDAVSFGDHAPRCSDRNCLYDYSIRNQRRAAALLNPTRGD